MNGWNDGAPLIICSKSRWQPAIRRDHALARLAANAGHPVVFVEQPLDIRALRTADRTTWLAGLAGRGATTHAAPGLSVLARTTIVPGHRNRTAQIVDAALLARSLRHSWPGAGATVIATTPWQWPALASLGRVRRVFDCADDWSRVMPSRRTSLLGLYERIGAEADAIVVDADALTPLFPTRTVSVVRNAVGRDLLVDPISRPQHQSALAYAGTLSERFDVPLVSAVLQRLPGWRLELYGQCRYPREGEGPGAELKALLDGFSDRVVWHGVVVGRELGLRLDAADVLVLPHRRQGAITGDAMKFYDYAARGRPVVSTRWTDGLADLGPPHLYLADTADEFAGAVNQAVIEPVENARERRSWAEQNTWDVRWAAWAEAVFGR